MNKIYVIIGIIILLLLVGFKNKIILGDYIEECLEYKVDSWIEIKCCDWTMDDTICRKMINKTHTVYDSYWTCEELTFWHRVKKTIHNTTNICIKYHLVRNTNNT